ncbi:hypothetical protein Gotur_010511 [Gossypium turneri]
MEKGFLDMVENNAAVRAWSEMTHHEKGDSLAEGYVSKLWDFTCISVTQNSLQELKKIWDQWNNKVDSSDVRKFYLPDSTVTSGEMTSQRRSGWQFFRICVKRMSNGEPRGCFRMRFCIDAVILIGFPCWEFGKLLAMPRC